MSTGARNWAVWCSPTEGVQRSVVESLGDFADEHGVAWPSVETLAEATGWGVRAVQKALKALVEAGVLKREIDYVRAYRKPGAHTTAYRLVVTLCRHAGEPDPSASWARNCTHGGVNKVHPPRPRVERRGGERRAPLGGAGGVNNVRGPANHVRQGGERGAPEPPLEPPLNDGSPSQVTVTNARDATTLRGVGPDDVACAACDTHHPRGRHLVPAPAPSDWRSRTVREHDQGRHDVPPPAADDVEVDDDLPWTPELDETEETYG